MKEERTLLQKLSARIRASATKVNPKAKKGFKASLKGRGFSKKDVKGALKRADALAKATAKAAKAPEEPQDKKTVVTSGVQKLVKIGNQLRPSPRQKKGF